MAALEQHNSALKAEGNGQGAATLTALQSEILELQKSLYYYKKRTKDLKKVLKASGSGGHGGVDVGSSIAVSGSALREREVRSPGGTVRKTAEDYYARARSAPSAGAGGGRNPKERRNETGITSGIPRRAKTASGAPANGSGGGHSTRLDFGQTYVSRPDGVAESVRGRKDTYVVAGHSIPERKEVYGVICKGGSVERGNGEHASSSSDWAPTDAAGRVDASASTASTSATSATSIPATTSATPEVTLTDALGLEASEDSLEQGDGIPQSPASLSSDSIDGADP